MRFSASSRSALVVALAAAILVGCGGQQVAQSGAAIVPSMQSSVVRSLKGENYCKGTHGVTASPCPVTLTTKRGVIVTVRSGSIDEASGDCKDQDWSCRTAVRLSPVKLRFKPLNVACGTGGSIITGSLEGIKVGTFYEKLIDNYCPGS